MATGSERYADLNRLSTEELKALLRADMLTAEGSNTDAMLYILEILEKRESKDADQAEMDVDQAWSAFQTVYHVPEGEGQSLYPETDEDETEQAPQQNHNIITFRRVFRKIGVVAAVVAMCVLSMVAVQASGVDIFGALARWSDETLQFVVSGNAESTDSVHGESNIQTNEYHQQIAELLAKHNIPVEFALRYLPKNFVMEAFEDSSQNADYVSCCFSSIESDEYLTIHYESFDDPDELRQTQIQKDETPVRQYVVNGMPYYRFRNIDNEVATWSDGESLLIIITGTISAECMDELLNGIG